MNTQLFTDLAASEEASGYPDNAAQLRAVPELVAALREVILLLDDVTAMDDQSSNAIGCIEIKARAALAPFQK